jgi:hypothetical protein
VIFQKFVYLLCIGSVLASCTAPSVYNPYVQGVHKKGVPVVSATRGTDEYISRETKSYKEYISALEEAKQENASDQKTEDVIDAYVSELQSEQITGNSFLEYTKLDGRKHKSLWRNPVGSVGEGVTLMDMSLRKRFNDALSTTPIGSQAKWHYKNKNFIFMPNSDVYQPYYSGGRCRDGVFVNFDEMGREEKLRGLFCQKGRGADWYYIR